MCLSFRSFATNVVPAMLLVAAVAVGPHASAQGAPDAAQRQKVAEAVEHLSSADPAERDSASKYLWSVGEAAMPALREAAAGDDAEAALRAAEILRHLRYGIRPDTPKIILDLLAQYRQSDRLAAGAAVTGLAARGPVGVRVLAGLWQEENDPERRRLLSQALSENARAAAALLLADRTPAAVVPLLDAATEAPAPLAERAMRDLAAVLALNGDAAALDERVARLKPLVADTAQDDAVRRRSARMLVYLCRARGDLSAARWAAEQAGDVELVRSVLTEARDWKALAEQSLPAQGPAADVEAIGFNAAYRRLAGDESGAAEWTTRLLEHLEKRPDDVALVVESLFLNDRPEDGMDLLMKHRQFAESAELLAPRMGFEDLFRLEQMVREQKETDLPYVEMRAAAARHFLGERQAPRQTVERLLIENDRVGDYPRYVALAETATSMRMADLADECAVHGLTAARPIDNVASLLAAAGYTPGERAARWWSTLRGKYKEPTRITFGRLRSLLRGELPDAQLLSLARAAAEDLLRANSAARDEWLLPIGDTFVDAGRADAARSYFGWLAGRAPVPGAFVRLGDLDAGAGQWESAAALYARAWDADRARPLPLLLRGAALAKLGRGKEAKELIDLAHLLPLADENARHALMVELVRRGMTDEARRERDALSRTAAFGSWQQGDAVRRAGDEAYEKGDYLTAAALWDRAFLDVQSTGTRFAEPWHNLAMPALVHRARALGLMRAGDLPAAFKEADLAMKYSPGDADAIIAVVNELDRLGRKPQAEGFYRKYTAPYRKLCETYPESGQAHNQLAWTQAKCNRELDDALRHATRAVELEPKNTASLDTLAETHFVRGEAQKAIEVMNRCVELEPKERRHQEQLARFSKALSGAAR